MVTGKQYAAKVMEAYNLVPKPGYIWGTGGVLWTEARQNNLVKRYNLDPIKNSDLKISAKNGAKWIGHMVWDCSGLTSERAAKLGLKYYHGSNSSWNKDCAYKGEMKMGMKLPAGAWVYTGTASSKPHIGVVVDDDWVVEAQGTNAGVVKTRVTASKWKYWGLGKGMTFDFIPGQTAQQNPVEEPPVNPVKTHATLRKGSRGLEVKEMQMLLSKDGFSLAIDGIFGNETLRTVKAFQKKHNLVVDGIAGPKTWGELDKIK